MAVRLMIGGIRGRPETEIKMPHELLGCQKQTDWHRLSHFGAKASLSMLPFRTVAISKNFVDMRAAAAAAAAKKYFTIVSFLDPRATICSLGRLHS